MNLNECQVGCASTAVYPDEARLFYTAFGLAGECGEGCQEILNFIFPNGQPKDQSERLVWATLNAIVGVGKQAETLKKIIRGDGALKLNLTNLSSVVKSLTDEQKQRIASEFCGDGTWYTNGMATDLGLSMDLIAQNLLNKLSARKNEGTLKGDGEQRTSSK